MRFKKVEKAWIIYQIEEVAPSLVPGRCNNLRSTRLGVIHL